MERVKNMFKGRMQQGAFAASLLCAFVTYFVTVLVTTGIGLYVLLGVIDLKNRPLTVALVLIPIVVTAICYWIVATSLCARRLHDINVSGYVAFLMFVPYINLLFALALMIIPGNSGDNQYGPEAPGFSIRRILYGDTDIGGSDPNALH